MIVYACGGCVHKHTCLIHVCCLRNCGKAYTSILCALALPCILNTGAWWNHIGRGRSAAISILGFCTGIDMIWQWLTLYKHIQMIIYISQMKQHELRLKGGCSVLSEECCWMLPLATNCHIPLSFHFVLSDSIHLVAQEHPTNIRIHNKKYICEKMHTHHSLGLQLNLVEAVPYPRHWETDCIYTFSWLPAPAPQL